MKKKTPAPSKTQPKQQPTTSPNATTTSPVNPQQPAASLKATPTVNTSGSLKKKPPGTNLDTVEETEKQQPQTQPPISINVDQGSNTKSETASWEAPSSSTASKDANSKKGSLGNLISIENDPLVPEYIKTMSQEVRLLMRLRHPNIIKLYQLIDFPLEVYLVM